MIYTVGLISVYEPAIAAGKAVKEGPGTDATGAPYPGGWVWETAEAAHAYLTVRGSLATRRVYGVVADWQADTCEVPGQPTRCLTRPAEVVSVTIQALSVDSCSAGAIVPTLPALIDVRRD